MALGFLSVRTPFTFILNQYWLLLLDAVQVMFRDQALLISSSAVCGLLIPPATFRAISGLNILSISLTLSHSVLTSSGHKRASLSNFFMASSTDKLPCRNSMNSS